MEVERFEGKVGRFRRPSFEHGTRASTTDNAHAKGTAIVIELLSTRNVLSAVYLYRYAAARPPILPYRSGCASHLSHLSRTRGPRNPTSRARIPVRPQLTADTRTSRNRLTQPPPIPPTVGAPAPSRE